MTDSRALYETLPIEQNSHRIRVLDIHDGTGEVKGDLRLIDIDSDEPPQFTALSYVWGTFASTPHHIQCSGYPVKITENGYSALLHLRRKLGAFTIWVDAICMDQGSDVDKSRQVPLMGDIYQRATTVYVWLGEGDVGTDRAMKFLSTAGFRRYFDDRPGGKSRPWAAAFVALIARWSRIRHPFPLPSRPRTLPHWAISQAIWKFRMWLRETFLRGYTTEKDLEGLLDRLWLRRLWTYQEILLASNPVVVCGSKHIDWATYEKALYFVWAATLHESDLHGIADTWRILARSRGTHWHRLRGTKPDTIREYGIFLRKTLSIFSVVSSVVRVAAMIPLVLFSAVLPIWSNVDYTSSDYDYPVGLLCVTSVVGAFLVMAIIAIYLKSYLNQTVWFDLSRGDPASSYDELLRGLYFREATNPKDMAFGLWGVVRQRMNIISPMPHYEENRNEIYRKFATDFVQCTDRMDILLAAAIKGIPSQPSWVPDISPSDDDVWSQMSEIMKMNETFGPHHPGLLVQGKWRLNSWRSPVLSYRARSSSFIRVCPNGRILTIRARVLGTVREHFTYRKTSPTHIKAEKDAHLHNTRCTVRLKELWANDKIWKPLSRHGNRYKRTDFPRALMDAYDTNVPGLDNDYIEKCQRVWPSGTLATDSATQARANVVNQSTLEAHSAVCNVLASSKNSVLYTGGASRDPDAFECVVGPKDAQVGDRILMVANTQIVLVVRPAEETRANAVKIVGPALILTDWCSGRVQKRYRLAKEGDEDFDIH